MNTHHQEILHQIKEKSGKPTQHTALDNYLGNSHFRYPISIPVLRSIGKTWMKENAGELSLNAFTTLLTSLTRGESSTEKTMAGILLDYAPAALRQFDPKLFDKWLGPLQGWAEVDTLCTGVYSSTEIANQFTAWKNVLLDFTKSKQIEKRRASLVLLVSPLLKARNANVVKIAFQNINRLKQEKEVMITKAISWLLRSAIKYHKAEVAVFIEEQNETLPRIALRETLIKLKTGKKTKSKKT